MTQSGTAPHAREARNAESEVRAFAAEYPTPHTLAALAYCESGRLTWDAVAELFRQSLITAIRTVA